MELLTSILEYLKDSWITYLLAVVGFIIGLAKFLDAVKKINSHWHDFQAKIAGRKITDQELKSEAQEVAKGILSLVNERQETEPQVDFDDFHNSTHNMSIHLQKTQNIYAGNYAAKVNNLRDEFLKIKLASDDVDRFYQHPTNYLGLRALAIGLATLSEKVKTPNQ